MKKKIEFNLIRRCKWCITRIGNATYFLNEEWKTVFSVPHFFGDAKFTDGIFAQIVLLMKQRS